MMKVAHQQETIFDATLENPLKNSTEQSGMIDSETSKKSTEEIHEVDNYQFQLEQKQSYIEELKSSNDTERGLLEEKIKGLEVDLEDSIASLASKDSQIEQLNRVVSELNEKRQNLLAKIKKLQTSSTIQNMDKTAAASSQKELHKESSNQLMYNINPRKLTSFLEDMERKLKQLYKDFISYSILKEEDKMQEIQLGINTLVEELNEFMDYSSQKLEYLKSKGILFDGQ